MKKPRRKKPVGIRRLIKKRFKSVKWRKTYVLKCWFFCLGGIMWQHQWCLSSDFWCKSNFLSMWVTASSDVTKVTPFSQKTCAEAREISEMFKTNWKRGEKISRFASFRIFSWSIIFALLVDNFSASIYITANNREHVAKVSF